VQDVANVILVRPPLRELVAEVKVPVVWVHQRVIHIREDFDFGPALRVPEEEEETRRTRLGTF